MDISTTLAKITARVNSVVQGFEGKVAQTGFFPSAHYPDGTPVAYVAAIQEYGSAANGIPARPFIRPTIIKRKGEWVKLLATGAKRVMEGAMAADDVLEGVGLQAAGDIRQTISEVQDPPLSPATIRARARKYADGKTTDSLGKPLVDTGLMISSVSNGIGPAD